MEIFSCIRNLAWQLDLSLGVAERKSILTGSEKLTYYTSPEKLSNWLSGVVKRLEVLPKMKGTYRSIDGVTLQQLHSLINNLDKSEYFE